MHADMLEQGRAVLAQQPFSVLLGARLDVFEPGRAQLSVDLSGQLLQQHGFVHGGVLAYLADNALTYAGGSVLGGVLTSEFKINYLRPARDAEQLVAVATVVGSGKTQAVCRCDIFLQNQADRKICAAAQGTIRKVE
ncbi:MAG: PaaI family thioesterase [Ramlibacter sp.]|nr:PaaI family thioesterase [Ramlibacter sp.]MCW5648605.1 PaaI family thioesterase [Ramlibacter sp.]